MEIRGRDWHVFPLMFTRRMAAQTEKFDPYHKWLGIPPEEQPPSYYRLLGLRDFEADADVISHAADRAMAHVRTFQNGPRAAWSQRLLNELATARVSLLDPRRKEAYDQSLQVKRGIQSLPHRAQTPPEVNAVAPPPVSAPNPPRQPTMASRPVSALAVRRRARKRMRETISFVVLLCILIGLVVTAAIVLRG
jgi:hypothetical protein